GLAPEGEAGRVDEDVDPAELLDGVVDEPLAARRVGDVELEREVGVDAIGPPSARDDPPAGGPERGDGGGADPARPACDDRRLPLERAHQVSLVQASQTLRAADDAIAIGPSLKRRATRAQRRGEDGSCRSAGDRAASPRWP